VTSVLGRFKPLTCGFSSGAKGTRTPDPHTASVVRYQLRHSPEKLCPSKLHHCEHAFKVAGQTPYPMTWLTTSRAVFCTSARCSGPLNDSA
jgi:hypothetical protein